MTGDQFREAKETLGWTRERLARELRVDLRTIARYLAGDVQIPGPVEVLVERFLEEGG